MSYLDCLFSKVVFLTISLNPTNQVLFLKSTSPKSPVGLASGVHILGLNVGGNSIDFLWRDGGGEQRDVGREVENWDG